MKTLKYNLSIDRLELTYRASDGIRNLLANIERKKEFEGVTVARVEKPQHYQHEFILYGKDYNAELGEYDRAIGVLFFGSLNQNRQHIYIN